MAPRKETIVAREREVTNIALTELEFFTLYEAFQLAPYNKLFQIDDTWFNSAESLSALDAKLAKVAARIGEQSSSGGK